MTEHDTNTNHAERETRARQIGQRYGSFLNPQTGAEAAYHIGYVDGLKFARRTYGHLIGLDFHDDSDTCQRCGNKHRGSGCNCSDL